MSETDVTKMKVADLKRELKVRGLVTTGNKTELQDRLQTALLDGDISLEDSAITNEDALLDEDAVLTDEEESPIAADENELLKSPTSTPTASELASPLNDNKTSADTTNVAPNPKKNILKRKSSFVSDDGKSVASKEGAPALTTAKENTEPPKEKVLKMSERNPITVSDLKGKDSSTIDLTVEPAGGKKVIQLSQMERLEMRAKKFGISTNTTTIKTTTPSIAPGALSKTAAKKTNNAKINMDIGGTIVNDAKQIEMLKKRAERFGCVVSSKMARIDALEKLQKRKERFGSGSASGAPAAGSVAAAAAAAAASAKGNDVWAEKARARLERFKNTSTLPAATDKKVDILVSSETTENIDNDAKKESTPITTPQSPTSVASN